MPVLINDTGWSRHAPHRVSSAGGPPLAGWSWGGDNNKSIGCGYLCCYLTGTGVDVVDDFDLIEAAACQPSGFFDVVLRALELLHCCCARSHSCLVFDIFCRLSSFRTLCSGFLSHVALIYDFSKALLCCLSSVCQQHFDTFYPWTKVVMGTCTFFRFCFPLFLWQQFWAFRLQHLAALPFHPEFSTSPP